MSVNRFAGRRLRVATAVLLAVATLGGAAGALAYDEQGPQVVVAPLITAGLVYSEHTGLLYASVPARSPEIPNELAWLDPTTGQILGSTPIGDDPGPLAVSGDGTVVYVGLNGSGGVRAFDVTTGTPGPPFSVGEEPGADPGEPGTPLVAMDIEVLPGDESAVAVLSRLPDSSTPYRLAVYDAGVERSEAVTHPHYVHDIEFGGSRSDLFGLGRWSYQHFRIDATGVARISQIDHQWSPYRARNDMEFAAGRMYGTLGHVFDPVTLEVFGSFFDRSGPLYRGIDIIEPDPTDGLTYVVHDPNTLGLRPTLETYDSETFELLASLPLPESTGLPADLVRAGPRLAYRTLVGQTSGQVITLSPPRPVVEVEIDIEPNDDINTVNANGRGVVTVALLGSADFDVSSIDTGSLQFAADLPGGAFVPGTAPFGQIQVRDVDRDGEPDLIARFGLAGTGIEASTHRACLTGATDDQVLLVRGCDAVSVRAMPLSPPMSPPISPPVSPPISGAAGTGQAQESTGSSGYAAIAAALFVSGAVSTRRRLGD